ncbi:MAG TPA: FG-GAP-like repeat-containing protein, partial [Micromonospora sp.]
SSTGATELRTRIDGNTSTMLVTLPTSGGRLVDVGERYAVVNGGSPAMQYVVDVPYREVVRTTPVAAASLWFDTLWTASSTPGQLTSTNLADGTAGRTVGTGVDCTPTELQATQRWLYWSCGADGPAGVHDLRQNVNIPVAAGPVLVGDGFLVRHDRAAGVLEMTEFHPATAQPPVRLADLPAGQVADEREITWAVDRNSGGVAYVDPDNAVHVLDTGVPTTPASVGNSDFHDISYPRATDWQANWTGNLRLSRPVSSWQVTVTSIVDGTVVNTRSAGPVRRGIFTSWNGRLPDGTPARNGLYRWTLTATVPGGAAATVDTGTLRVACGTFPFRSYDCYSGPALLGVKSNGEGHWYNSAYDPPLKNRLYDHGYTDRWCLNCTGSAGTSAIVPFGDFDGDGMPDVITRSADGVLHAWLGIGQSHFGERQEIRMGSGWNAYPSILAPGDLNRDGFDDLVATDTYGVLWLYESSGHGGFGTRIKIGSGWTIYSRVVGVGDLNGDGNGDLLAIDKSGVMYRYFGNGQGGFGARALVGTGWTIYNAVVPIGDLNQDGRTDFLARDSGGYLWLYAGDGQGLFSPRVQVGNGWNIFQKIF